LLISVFSKQAVSEVMKNVKAKSSKWLNESRLLENRFEWQSAFGAFTYSEKDIQKVFDYVRNQEIHHKKMTFREEYLMMLKAHKVDFLPDYIFKELV
jgi:putative transposase